MALARRAGTPGRPACGERRTRSVGGGRVGQLGRGAQAPLGRVAPQPRRRTLGPAGRKAAGFVMRLSELLNRKVVTESGDSLGRIHDVRAELVGGRLRVTG